jgi:hypothetical protein
MRIGVDIDDTLINTKEVQIAKWEEYVTNNHNSRYTKELPKNINHFGDPYIDRFWDEYREVLSFSPSFKKGAAEALMHLRSLGNEVIIITSRPQEKYKDLTERINNMCLENGLEVDKIATDVRDKGLYCLENDIHILIDDDIRHIHSANKAERYTILFNEDKNYFGLQLTDWYAVDKVLTVVTDKDYAMKKILS